MPIIDCNVRSRLEEDGYILVENVVPIALLDKVKEFSKNVFSIFRESELANNQLTFWSKEKDKETLRIPNLEHINNNSLLHELSQELLTIVNGLDEKRRALRTIHSFFKPALSGGITPFHQDPAYSNDDQSYDNLTVWVPLGDVPKESSCLSVIPSSHKDKKLYQHIPIKEDVLSALRIVTDTSKAIAIPCNYGDAILHKSYLVHGATENKSHEDRIALIFVYSPT